MSNEPTPDPSPDEPTSWSEMRTRMSELIDERLDAHHARTRPPDPPQVEPSPPAPAPAPAKEPAGDPGPAPSPPTRAKRSPAQRWFGIPS